MRASCPVVLVTGPPCNGGGDAAVRGRTGRPGAGRGDPAEVAGTGAAAEYSERIPRREISTATGFIPGADQSDRDLDKPLKPPDATGEPAGPDGGFRAPPPAGPPAAQQERPNE
ncbi:hypothetical protein GCM10027174_03110 [Salinifilum aidingensis]